MQKFWWPGYEVQLVRELQRQQNCSQFCDTLLQTEGISVPTHSCVLAALSPYLSQKLSASPSPSRGQKRCLQLQTVTAQTLLKLVGLLYSGELEVRGIKEQNEVLAAAHQFGIGDLVLGCKNRNAKGGNRIVTGFHTEQPRIRHRNLKIRDTQVQDDPSAKKKSLVSVSTQTVEAGGTSAFIPERPPPVATPLQPQNLWLREKLSFTLHPTIHSCDEPRVRQPSDSVTNLTSSSTLSASLEDEPSPPRSQEEKVSQQSSEPGDGVVNKRWGDGKGNDKLTEDGGSMDQLGQVIGDETALKETEKSRNVCDGTEWEIMKENRRNNTPISVKVKLRRTKEEEWEVVNWQDREASDLTAVKRKTPQTDLNDLQNPAPPGLMIQNLEAPDLHPDIAAAPEAPGPTSTNSDPRSNTTLNQSLQPQGQGPGEDSQEDINWILEDIIMALNILPNSQVSHDGVLNCNQITDNGIELTHMQHLVPEAGCVFYQDSSAGAAVHCCIGAQNQPSCAILSAARSDLLTQQQLQSSEFNSSISLTEKSHRTNFQGSEMSPYPQPGCAPSSDHPGLQQLSSQSVRDMRISQLLSPLGPHSPEAQQHPGRSHNPEKDVQLGLRQRSWFTETPRLLQLPVSTLLNNKTNPLPQHANSSCGSEQLGWKPGSWDSCAESSTVDVVEDRGTKSDPGGRSDPQKRRRQRRRYDVGGAVIPRKRIRKRKNIQQDSEGCGVASKKLKVCDGATAFSVRSSCSSVPVKESRAASKPSDKLCTRLKKTNKIVTACGNEEPKVVVSLGPEQTRIRTRAFVKRIQEKISDKIQENCVLVPVVCRAVIKKEQTVTLQKRTRGRPRKVRLVETTSNSVPEEPQNAIRDKVSEQQADKDSSKVEEDGERKTRCRKLRRHAKKAGAGHLREMGSAESLEKAGEEAPRQSWMVTLKKFQRLMKQQHSKTRTSTEIQEVDKSVREDEKREDGSDKDVEMEGQDLPDVMVDENHNQSVVTSAATGGIKPRHDVLRDSGPGDSASDDVQEDNGVQVSPERVTNPEEGRSEALRPQIKEEGTSCAETWLPQATMEAHDCNEQKTGIPLPKGDVTSVTSGSDLGDEEEEDVDILLFSPEHDSLTQACEGGLYNTPITPDKGEEEQEDDNNEIDVTGDDTE